MNSDEELLLRAAEERHAIVEKYRKGRHGGVDIPAWEEPSYDIYQQLDRYGFIQDEKNQEVLSPKEIELGEQRVKKWIKMFNNWDKLSAEKLRKRVYKGVPDKCRSTAWMLLLNVGKYQPNQIGYKNSSSNDRSKLDQSNQKFRDRRKKYEEMRDLAWKFSPDIRQIDLDVNRTYREHIMFRDRYSSKQQELFNVLAAYSLYNMEIGYCQGMSQIVALLLMYLDEEQAFWALCSLVSDTKYSMHGFFIPGFPKLLRFQEHHDKIMNKFIPQLKKHLDKNSVDTGIYTLKWFFQCFLDRIPFKLTLRVWDIYLLEGDCILSAMAYNLLKMHKEQLLRLTMDDILYFIQVKMEKQYQFGEDVTIENLQKCLVQLKRYKLDHAGKATPAELPKTPLGLFKPDAYTLSFEHKIGRRTEFSSTEKETQETVISRRDTAVRLASLPDRTSSIGTDASKYSIIDSKDTLIDNIDRTNNYVDPSINETDVAINEIEPIIGRKVPKIIKRETIIDRIGPMIDRTYLTENTLGMQVAVNFSAIDLGFEWDKMNSPMQRSDSIFDNTDPMIYGADPAIDFETGNLGDLEQNSLDEHSEIGHLIGKYQAGYRHSISSRTTVSLRTDSMGDRNSVEISKNSTFSRDENRFSTRHFKDVDQYSVNKTYDSKEKGDSCSSNSVSVDEDSTYGTSFYIWNTPEKHVVRNEDAMVTSSVPFLENHPYSRDLDERYVQYITVQELSSEERLDSDAEMSSLERSILRREKNISRTKTNHAHNSRMKIDEISIPSRETNYPKNDANVFKIKPSFSKKYVDYLEVESIRNLNENPEKWHSREFAATYPPRESFDGHYRNIDRKHPPVEKQSNRASNKNDTTYSRNVHSVSHADKIDKTYDPDINITQRNRSNRKYYSTEEHFIRHYDDSTTQRIPRNSKYKKKSEPVENLEKSMENSKNEVYTNSDKRHRQTYVNKVKNPSTNETHLEGPKKYARKEIYVDRGREHIKNKIFLNKVPTNETYLTRTETHSVDQTKNPATEETHTNRSKKPTKLLVTHL